jgi:preprotein translocase subunit SecE
MPSENKEARGREKESNSLAAKIMQWPVATKNYFDDLHMEMRRVTWPNWKQVRATTLVVVVTVFAFAGYFAIVDGVIARGINKIFDAFAK